MWRNRIFMGLAVALIASAMVPLGTVTAVAAQDRRVPAPAPDRPFAGPMRTAPTRPPASAPAPGPASIASPLTCNGSWSIVGTPDAYANNELNAIAAITPNDIWAVGDNTSMSTNGLQFDVRQPLTEHWDGSSWTIFPSADTNGGTGDNILASVGAVASNDAWAVGFSDPLPPGQGGTASTLIERWNGGPQWSIVASPNASGSNFLFSVKGDAANDYWAVGESAQSGSAQTLAMHWNGSAWSIVATPNPTTYNALIAVKIVAANNVWAVGTKSADAITNTTLIEHWNGSSWSVVPSQDSSNMNGVLNGVDGTANDLYAVGAGASTSDFTMVEHWDGTSWSLVPNIPTGGNTDAFSVAYVSSSDITVVGTTFGGTNTAPADHTFIFHWDGTAWTQQTSADTGTSSELFDVAAIGGDRWTVGVFRNVGNTDQTLAENSCVAPGAPTQVQAIAGDTEATVTWKPPASTGGIPITSYTVTASPGGATTTVSPVTPAATITGLTNGTAYTFTVAATSMVGTGPASAASPAVTPATVAQATAVAVLPAMASGAYGGYLTVAYIENFNASPAHVRVQYFDTSGNPVGFGNSVAGLPFWGTWTLRTDNGDSLTPGLAGSAVIYSDQPLAVFVNEFAPNNSSDATSYSSIKLPSGSGTTIFAPAIANNAYGGYTTGIGLINAGSAPTDVRVTYRDTSGATIKVQTLTAVPANAYQGLYSGDVTLALPDHFAGTATIESTSATQQPLAAVVNEVGPGGQFSSYDAVSSGSTTLNGPAALNNAFGGFFTGTGIQETSGASGTVTIAYYDGSGALVKTTSAQPIAANGYLGVYQGDPTLGPPASSSGYTMVLTSTVPIAAIVNEVAPSATTAMQSTAYDTFPAGASTSNLPLVESAGADGWSTGEGIMNTGATTTSVTITYFDPATGATVGTPQTVMLAPLAFWGVYQPTAGLPNGTRASAQVSTTGGEVAVICNESNPGSFMSYTGQ